MKKVVLCMLPVVVALIAVAAALPAFQPEAEEPAPAPATDAPNANPVQLGAAEAPVGEDGKLDPTRIASPEDFGNWDDLGCRG